MREAQCPKDCWVFLELHKTTVTYILSWLIGNQENRYTVSTPKYSKVPKAQFRRCVEAKMSFLVKT